MTFILMRDSQYLTAIGCNLQADLLPFLGRYDDGISTLARQYSLDFPMAEYGPTLSSICLIFSLPGVSIYVNGVDSSWELWKLLAFLQFLQLEAHPTRFLDRIGIFEDIWRTLNYIEKRGLWRARAVKKNKTPRSKTIGNS